MELHPHHKLHVEAIHLGLSLAVEFRFTDPKGGHLSPDKPLLIRALLLQHSQSPSSGQQRDDPCTLEPVPKLY